METRYICIPNSSSNGNFWRYGKFKYYNSCMDRHFKYKPCTSLYISKTRNSYDIIKETGEFAINLTNSKLVFATDWCGVKSGRDVDKFKEMHLTKQKLNHINCPGIEESPVTIECKVKEIRPLGSHDMFIADVLSIDADKKYIDEKGAFDISKCDLIAYANGRYFEMGKQVGTFGYSVRKKK